MALLDEIAAKLAALGLGTVGVDIHKGHLPADGDVCCAIFEYPGQPPTYGLGAAGVRYQYPRFQVLLRGAPDDYTGPRNRAATAYAGLAAVEATTLSVSGGSSAFYCWIHPLGEPHEQQRDASRRVLIACNYEVEKEPSA